MQTRIVEKTRKRAPKRDTPDPPTPERHYVEGTPVDIHEAKQKHAHQFPNTVEMNKQIQQYMAPYLVRDEILSAHARSVVLKMYGLPVDLVYFPGALPCSLMRKDLDYLKEMDYVVTEKTDGVRHLLVIFRQGETSYSLLVDRAFRFYYTSYQFSRGLHDGLGTLLDGEMIWEPTGYKYLVHDIVCCGGRPDVATLSYHRRMHHVTELLRWFTYPPKNPKHDIITLLPKPIYPLGEIRRLWYDVIPNLHHRCDGLILTPNDLPHTGKKNRLLYKWKQPIDHTIDLQLAPGPNPHTWNLMTWDTVNYHLFCDVTVSPNVWMAAGIHDPQHFVNAIVECRYDFDLGVWIPVNLRPDKVKPNDVSTIRLTMETILECLTIEELLNLGDNTKFTRRAMDMMDPSEYYKP